MNRTPCGTKSLCANIGIYEPPLSIFNLSPPKGGGPWKAICNAIFNHDAAKHFIPDLIRMKIGDENVVLFCNDLWVGERSIKSVCLRLFLLAQFPNGTLNSCGF